MLQVTTQYTPESPSHLIYCGKLEQAARSLQWLRGDTVDVTRELATIQINIQRSRQQKVRLTTYLLDNTNLIELIRLPHMKHF